MLGIFLLYFIGKKFYDLSEAHKKPKWRFVILGIVCYYGGGAGLLFLGGFVVGVIDETLIDNLSSGQELMVNLLGIPAGLLCCWGFYKILQHQWQKAPQTSIGLAEDVLDADFMDKPLG